MFIIIAIYSPEGCFFIIKNTYKSPEIRINRFSPSSFSLAYQHIIGYAVFYGDIPCIG